MAQPFDLRTRILDPKTKRVIKYQHYRLHIKGGVKKFERPVGSGNLWYENGEPANDHKDYVPPMTSDQALRAEFTAKDSKIRKLEDQLAAAQKETAQIKGQGKTVAEMMPKPKAEQPLVAKNADTKGKIAIGRNEEK